MLPFRYPDKPTNATTDFLHSLNESEWIAQGKYDGWRMLIYIDGVHNIRLLSRENSLIEKSCRIPADLRHQISHLNLPADTVLDTELVGPRGHLNTCAYIFDILALNGNWLVNLPFQQRWDICKNIKMPQNGLIRLAETINCGFTQYFNKLRSDWKNILDLSLFEGIVVKRRNGTLFLNRFGRSQTSGHAFKIKFRDIRREIK